MKTKSTQTRILPQGKPVKLPKNLNFITGFYQIYIPGTKIWAILLVFLLSASVVQAVTKTSTGAGGNWNTAATWSPSGVPAAGDAVIIASGSPVTINANVTQTAAGSVTINTGAILNVTVTFVNVTLGALTINTGGTATVYRNLTILGTTNITGTINFGSTSATVRSMTFTGAVTLNAGAVWNETTNGAAATFSFGNSLTNNATTFTAQNTAHNFTATGTLSGLTATVIPTVTFSANYTNNGTLTSGTLLTVTGPAIRLTNNGVINAATALSGTGGVIQGTTGVLNLGGTSGINTLTATAVGNTVNYTGAAQTVKATSYNNLSFSGSLAKTIANGTSVTGNLSITGVTANIGAGLNINVGSLTLGGLKRINGTWGSTTSTASFKNNTFFTATSGMLNVASDTRPATVIVWNNPADIIYGTALSATQLNATASPAGAFVYNPLASTILNAGASQTLSVTFTPTDQTSFTTKTMTVVINVNLKELIVINAVVAGKIYDGNTDATISGAALQGVVTGDEANVILGNATTGTFDNANAGTGKSVTTAMSVSGTRSNNYSFSLPVLSGSITRKELTVIDASVETKVYDGSTDANIIGATLDGIISGDEANVFLGDETFGTFNNANVGTGKTVTVAMTISGTKSGNYSLTQPNLTGEITAISIVVTPDPGQGKIAGESDPVLTYTFSPALISPDVMSGTLGRVSGETVGSYSYILNDLSAGANYSLSIVSSPSTFEISAVTGIEDINMKSGLMFRNYPNPFIGNTTISYTLPVDGKVTLTIRNLAGQVVKTLINEMETRGDYNLNIDAGDLQSGIYLGTLTININGKEMSKTIRLIKGK